MFYTQRSNAKRAGINAIVKENNIPVNWVKLNFDELLTIDLEDEGFTINKTSKTEFLINRAFGSEKPKVKHVVKKAAPKAAPKAAKKVCSKSLLAKANEEAAKRTKAEQETPVKALETVKSIKIEKNRDESNGIKRPSVGGKCREIWDFCDTLNAQGIVPNSKDIREEGKKHGWQKHTMSTQAYYWRKFHATK